MAHPLDHEALLTDALTESRRREVHEVAREVEREPAVAEGPCLQARCVGHGDHQHPAGQQQSRGLAQRAPGIAAGARASARRPPPRTPRRGRRARCRPRPGGPGCARGRAPLGRRPGARRAGRRRRRRRRAPGRAARRRPAFGRGWRATGAEARRPGRKSALRSAGTNPRRPARAPRRWATGRLWLRRNAGTVFVPAVGGRPRRRASRTMRSASPVCSSRTASRAARLATWRRITPIHDRRTRRRWRGR